MRKILALVVALMLAASVPAFATNDKVTICHHTGSETNPTVTIEISTSAWAAHQEHGDTQGPCPTASPTQTAYPSKSPSPSPSQSQSPSSSPSTSPQPTLPTCPPNLVGVATGCTRTQTPAASATPLPSETPFVLPTPSPTAAPTAPPIIQLPSTSTN